MADPIVIADDVRLQIEYVQQELLHVARPFIESVSRSVALKRSLEDSVLAAAELYPDAARNFVIERGHIEESFSLRPEHLFGEWHLQSLRISSSTLSNKIDLLNRSPAERQEVRQMLELCGSGVYDRAATRARLGEYARPIFDALLARGSVGEGLRGRPFAPPDRYGVYRLQHASLLYRSAKTGLLVDPHLHSSYRPDLASDIHRDQLQNLVDVILISHFHEDHWFLSTLMSFPRDTPIVVPKVPRSTIICGDMREMLQSLGFRNVVAVDWYSEPLHFGDIEVHVLPFYGEQPLRFERSRDADIRNWGNTYLIRTSHYTSWFLIDSGADALGSMTEVAERVRAKFGPVDFVLSNLRRFYVQSPIYINGGFNWLTLSPLQLLNFVSMRDHCITLGPRGVAEVCKIVDATYYLPYAHWWSDVGSPGEGEGDLLAELRACLSEIHARTSIVEWNIGDRFAPQPYGEFHREPV
ncbi:MAG: MBL fold metallo-hydrolase [Beijerinckiaceae bacterium]